MEIPETTALLRRGLMTSISHTACMILVAVLSSSSLLGQLSTASISGTLTDPSGAVVSDALATAVETSTGTVTRSISNSAGFYVLTGLAPGQYRVRVEKAGFQTYVQKGVVVEVSRSVVFSKVSDYYA